MQLLWGENVVLERVEFREHLVVRTVSISVVNFEQIELYITLGTQVNIVGAIVADRDMELA